MKTIQLLIKSYIFNENKAQTQECTKEIDSKTVTPKAITIFMLFSSRMMSRENFLWELLIFFFIHTTRNVKQTLTYINCESACLICGNIKKKSGAQSS